MCIYIGIVCLKVKSINCTVSISLYNADEPKNSTVQVQNIPFCSYQKSILLAIKKAIDTYEMQCTILNIYSASTSISTFIEKYKTILDTNNIEKINNLDINRLPITKSVLLSFLNRPQDTSKLVIRKVEKDNKCILIAQSIASNEITKCTKNK